MFYSTAIAILYSIKHSHVVYCIKVACLLIAYSIELLIYIHLECNGYNDIVSVKLLMSFSNPNQNKTNEINVFDTIFGK